jgi:hypothetical protein
MRVYAGEPERISSASGTIELMIRPIAWGDRESRDSRAERVVFRAEGPPEAGAPRSAGSSIQLSIVPYESLEFTIMGPSGNRFNRSADIRSWQLGDWHRVTMSWGPAQTQTDLYVDGVKATIAERRPTRPGTSRRTAPSFGQFADRYYGGPGAYPRGIMSAPNRTTAPSRTTASSVSVDRMPSPRNLTKIYLGRTESAPDSAGVDIDNLVILRRTPTNEEISRPIEYNDDILMFDTFQTAYGDTRLLVSTLQDMEGCVKLIRDSTTKEDLKEEKRKEYELLRDSIGLPDEELNARSPYTQYLVKVLIADQIHRLIEGRYTLDEIKRILDVPRATRGSEAEQRALTTALGFVELTLDFVEQAKSDGLAELSQVKILGESTTTSDADVMAAFKQMVDDLREKLGIQELEFPGMMGMAGRMGAAARYYGGMAGYGMMGPMGGQSLPAAYKPSDDSPEKYQEAFTDYQSDYNKYNRWKKDLQKNVIPPDARAIIAQGSGDSLYTRRILVLEALGKIDYLPNFLYNLEYEDRLASLQWISLERGKEDLIKCGVGVDIHYISNEPIPKPGETEETEEPEEVAAAGTR